MSECGKLPKPHRSLIRVSRLRIFAPLCEICDRHLFGGRESPTSISYPPYRSRLSAITLADCPVQRSFYGRLASLLCIPTGRSPTAFCRPSRPCDLVDEVSRNRDRYAVLWKECTDRTCSAGALPQPVRSRPITNLFPQHERSRGLQPTTLLSPATEGSLQEAWLSHIARIAPSL